MLAAFTFAEILVAAAAAVSELVLVEEDDSVAVSAAAVSELVLIEEDDSVAVLAALEVVLPMSLPLLRAATGFRRQAERAKRHAAFAKYIVLEPKGRVCTDKVEIVPDLLV